MSVSTYSTHSNKVSDELDKVLREAAEERDFPALLHSLCQLAGRPTDAFSVLPSSTLSRIAVHFGSFSSLSAFHWANGLSALLKSENQQDNPKTLIVLLLRSLVDNVPLLNANRLRAFIKNEIVGQCTALWRSGQSDLASTLTLCVVRTLVMELSYLEAVQSRLSHDDLIREARKTWTDLLSTDILKNDPGAFLHLSLLLFHSALGMEYSWANPTTEEVTFSFKRCASEREKGYGKCGSLYCASLVDLLLAHLSTFCHLLLDDARRAMFEFLIDHAQRKDSLEHLLQGVAKNPGIRYGKCCERVFQSISALLVPSSSVNFVKMWAIETEDSGKKEHAAAQRVDEGQLSWHLLLTLSEERVAETLANVSNAKLERIVLSANFGGLQPKECLRLLNSLAKIKRSLLIPFRSEFIELMLAEEAPKSRSLEFAAKLLEMHAHFAESDAFPAKSDFVSFCLAIFQPIDQLDDCDQSAKHDFLLAELSFLRSLFSFLPQLLISFAPLIVQLLPEFFVWSNFYRKTLSEWPEFRFADRLEHSLTSLCREIVRRKKCFNKLLPFAISSSLTGDRVLCFPMYLLFSALDENDFSLLSSNLSAGEKRKFGQLKAQFYASNKIIG